MKHIGFKPIWFDSLGAKSSCTLVKTPDTTVLIDPGIAVMQPSFPASWAKKFYWMKLGKRAIKKSVKKAKIIVISHYHYDHYFPEDMDVYKNKLLLTKSPNEYINDSQRGRAEDFFENICEAFGNVKLKDVVEKRKPKKYRDPLKELPIARKKVFGDYNQRRKELLKKGLRWFKNRVKNWNKSPKIPELKFKEIETKYPEGKKFKFGKTTLRFTKPLFHGIEFSRVGWVFSTIVEYKKEKLIHSSDLDGPMIEDYAKWIIKENPDVLILDGPTSYMLGYMLNRINLNRCIENISKIVEKIDSELIIYDHHLPREKKFRERTKKVWDTAKKRKKKVLTVAEFLGKEPVALRV
jgi:hypothetical protein